MPRGASFFEDVPLVKFIYLVFTRTPGGVTVGDSGLCCCCPLSIELYYFPLFVDSNPFEIEICLLNRKIALPPP